MKRAKLILGAIAVFAVVGGVYASKARDNSKFVYVPSTTLPTTFCPVKIAGYTLDEVSPTTFRITATTLSTLPCAITTVYKTI